MVPHSAETDAVCVDVRSQSTNIAGRTSAISGTSDSKDTGDCTRGQSLVVLRLSRQRDANALQRADERRRNHARRRARWDRTV